MLCFFNRYLSENLVYKFLSRTSPTLAECIFPALLCTFAFWGFRKVMKLFINVNRYNTRAVNYYRAKGMTVARQGDFPIGNGYYMNDYIMQLDI